MPINRLPLVILVGVASVAGCSSSRGGSAAVNSTAVAVVTTGNIVAPSTTAPPSVVLVDPTLPPLVSNPTPDSTPPAATAATTAVILSPEDGVSPLLLRSDGFGLFNFGAPMIDVLVGSPSDLGGPTSDTSADLPVADGAQFVTEDGSTGFAFPINREFCWAEFCLIFGASTEDSLALVGWRYQTSGSATVTSLANVDGVTLGSRWSDFADAYEADPGGCYTVGAGATADGIVLLLQGGLFSKFDELGNYEVLLPDPAEVTVLAMSAGEQIEFLEGDC